MDFENVVFKRVFSANLRKKLRIKLCEMSFESDFTVTDKGNLYPAVDLLPQTRETVENGVYSVHGGMLKRLICEHFPYAEYSINIPVLKGKAGFSFYDSKTNTVIDIYIESTADGYTSSFCVNGQTFTTNMKLPAEINSVSFGTRGKSIDIYYSINGHINHSGSVDIDALESALDYPFSFKTLFYCDCESFETDKIEAYIDNGLALADMKPVRYTDGSIVIHDGRIFFTMSSRLGAHAYQSVISWLPATFEFKIEGAIFFDVGKIGKISSDIASCILYDKQKQEYLIWMCAFSSGHVLGYGKTDSDILHGISIIDITLMDKKDEAAETDFYAAEGDEDPDFYYDSIQEKWYLSICRHRIIDAKRTYSYVKFVSDEPFSNYRFFKATRKSGETGGMTTEIDGKRYFICGAEFSAVSKYRIYDAETLELITEAEYDYPDGGFRGWGTLFPVKTGNRQRIFQLTFDRAQGSDYNWSYGNIYVFEAVEKQLY